MSEKFKRKKEINLKKIAETNRDLVKPLFKKTVP